MFTLCVFITKPMYFQHFQPDTNPDTLRFHYKTNVFSTIQMFEALLASLHHHHVCLRSFHTGLLSIVYASLPALPH